MEEIHTHAHVIYNWIALVYRFYNIIQIIYTQYYQSITNFGSGLRGLNKIFLMIKSATMFFRFLFPYYIFIFYLYNQTFCFSDVTFTSCAVRKLSMHEYIRLFVNILFPIFKWFSVLWICEWCLTVPENLLFLIDCYFVRKIQ